MPTLAEYTEHLMQDKENMRSYLASANIESKESDTFTELSQTVVENSGTQLCVYAQPDEPTFKYGVWFKTDEPKTITGIKAKEHFYVKDSWAKVEGIPQTDTLHTHGCFSYGGYVYYMEDAANWVRYPLADNFGTKETLCSLTEVFGEDKVTASNLFPRGWAYWNGYIYACASLVDYGAPTPYPEYNCDIVRYSIENNTWEYVNTLMHPTYENTSMPIREMAAVNGYIYMFGSHFYDASLSTARAPFQNKYWMLNVETNEMHGPIDMPMSRFDYAVNAVVGDRYIYLFGSRYYGNSIASYNPNTTAGSTSYYCRYLDTYDHKWTQFKEFPETGYGADGVQAIAIESDIYLMGCLSKTYSTYSGYQCYRYDTLTNTYTRLPRSSSKTNKYAVAYDAERRIIVVYGNSTVNKYFYQESVGQNFPEGTVVLDQCLPVNGKHTCQFYYNDKFDTTDFKTTYFNNIYLWDEANGDRYHVDTYIGNGTKWTKINQEV